MRLNNPKIFLVFYVGDVRKSEIKLQLNNAVNGRLKRNSRPSAVVFYFTMCDGLYAAS